MKVENLKHSFMLKTVLVNYELNFRFLMTPFKKENLGPNTSFSKYLSENGGNFQKNHQYPLSSSSQGHAL
jgi:hypothetical protein